MQNLLFYQPPKMLTQICERKDSEVIFNRIKKLEKDLDLKIELIEFFEDFKSEQISISKLKAYLCGNCYFDFTQKRKDKGIINPEYYRNDPGFILFEKIILKLLPNVDMSFNFKIIERKDIPNHELLLLEEYIQKFS